MRFESFDEFAIEFINQLISEFTDIVHHKFLITSEQIKLQLYCEEKWEEIDLRALHSICKEATNKYIDELKLFNFDKIFFSSSNPEKGKITVKWVKILDN